MSTSANCFRGRGFWANDIYLGVFAQLMANAIEQRQLLTPQLGRLRDECRFHAQLCGGGFLTLPLEQFATNAAQIAILFELLDAVERALDAYEDVIPTEQLPQTNAVLWEDGLPTTSVRKVAHSVRALLLNLPSSDDTFDLVPMR